MTSPDGPPAARALLRVPGAGGHGPARLEAITAITHALGCATRDHEPLTRHRQRSRHGDYYLTIWGPEPVVAWLRQALPGILAALNAAAAASARSYAAWLRDRCPEDDHMPAERPGLRAAWRRAYLRGYGTAVAARIRGRALPPAGSADREALYRAGWAERAAEQDAVRASLAPYTPSLAPIIEDSALRAITTATRRRPRRAPELPACRGRPQLPQ